MSKPCSCLEHRGKHNDGRLSRGLFLYVTILPICKCGHHWEKHLSGDKMSHYGLCHHWNCPCYDFSSMDNLKYLEHQYEQKR